MKLVQLAIYLTLTAPIHALCVILSYGIPNKFFRSFRFPLLVKAHCENLLVVPSTGEIEYIRPLLSYPCFKSRDLAFFSPSHFHHQHRFETLFREQFKLAFDSIFGLFQFIQLKPKIVVFSRMQISPFFLFFLEQKKIPFVMVSASFKGKTLNRGWKQKLFSPWLKSFSKIFLEDEQDMEIAKKIGLTNCCVTGSPRIDTVLERQKNSERLPLVEKFKSDQKLLILASVWKTDLHIIRQDLESIIGLGFKILVVPHEFEESYSREFPGANLYSRGLENSSNYMIVDKTGILFPAYKYADAVYVGGAFGSDVHSTLEPASFSLPLFYGPNIRRSYEAQKFVEIGGAKIIRNSGNLLKEIKKMPEGVLNRKFLEKSQGASLKILQEIENQFFKTSDRISRD